MHLDFSTLFLQFFLFQCLNFLPFEQWVWKKDVCSLWKKKTDRWKPELGNISGKHGWHPLKGKKKLDTHLIKNLNIDGVDKNLRNSAVAFKHNDLASFKKIIKEIDTNIIQNVSTFDVYIGENIPNDKKSVAINVTLRSSNKTLSENDLDLISKKIIESVKIKTGATIRS